MIPWLGLYAMTGRSTTSTAGGFRGVWRLSPGSGRWRLVFAAITALVGERLWSAHLALLLLRWLDAVLLWRVLGRVWPATGRTEPALWALCCPIYPAFKQMPWRWNTARISSPWDCCGVAVDQPAPGRWPAAAAGAKLDPGFAGLAGLLPGIHPRIFVGLELLAITDLAGLKKQMELKGRPAPLMAWLLSFRPGGVPGLAGVWPGVPVLQPELLGGLAASPLSTLAELAVTIARDAWWRARRLGSALHPDPGGQDRTGVGGLVG